MGLFGKDGLTVIRRCPYTRDSNGVVHMPPELVAELAGMVQLDNEWAFVMRGRRNGLETWVHSFEAPKQRRSGSSVDIVEDINCGAQAFDGSDDLDIVGVIHSHHMMGAFFSGTDENELNPRFPLSIVIAQGKQILGFSYKAEGRYPLPCGDLGIIPYKIQPMVEDWPWQVEPLFEDDGRTEWDDCKRVVSKESEIYWIDETADCGVSHKFPKATVFGRTQLMKDELDKNSEISIAVNRNLPAVYHPQTPDVSGGYGGLELAYEGWAMSQGYLSQWQNNNVDKKKYEAVDSTNRWAYMNEYKCPKCKSEWSDVGHAMETSFCEKCNDLADVSPHHSFLRGKEQGKEKTIPYFCAACRDEGEYKGDPKFLDKEPCPRCGNVTLVADSTESTPPLQKPFSEYRVCSNCNAEGQYTGCTKEYEMCPDCKQYALMQPSKEQQISLLKQAKNAVTNFLKQE